MPPTPPQVSVIVPVYNRERLVQRAIASALRQTLAELELIVVDDASTDRTAAVVGAITDPRLRLIRHPTNQGGAAARNTGLQAARGTYVAFLDSDDEWLPDKLAIQLRRLQETGAALAYCQCWVPHGQRGKTVHPARPFAGPSLLRYLVCETRAAMQTSGLVVRRDLAPPFDESLPCHQDWDWVIQLARHSREFVFVAQPLYEFHADAPVRTSRETSRPMIAKAQPFLDKHAAEIAAHPCIKRNLVVGYARHALEQGNRRLARSILRQHRVWPSLWHRPRAVSLWLRCLSPQS